MHRTTHLLLAATLCACAATPRGDAAHGDHGMDADPSTAAFLAPIELYPRMTGEFSRPISSDDPRAQAYFDQGMQLRYAYAVDAAARSFREAWHADPDCAICYWGEAWSLGSYLNGAKTTAKAPHALAAARKAAELADEHASPVEQALIEAIGVWHVENYDPATRRAEDRKFAAAMADVHARYPEDLDVATVYAAALFLLEPRRGTRDLDDPDVRRLHRVLEDALARDLRHPGACHLYIHATESTVKPELALPCAEHLGDAIPGASHINHMPSHTYNGIGRWGDAVRANVDAWHSDLKAAAGYGVAIYESHNLHMLLFAASMDGQGAVAMQAAKDYRKLTGNTMYEVLTRIRFGRFDEVPGIDDRPDDAVAGALWDFAQGYAALRNGRRERAEALRDDVLEFAASTEATFRFHPAEHVVGTVARILDGELKRDAGDLEGAIAAFREAVAVEDRIGYDEPEPLPFAARHWLGAAELEAGRHADAEATYRAELEDHPANGWSLYGLREALAAQGKPHDAVDAELAASLARADTWIRASRF